MAAHRYCYGGQTFQGLVPFYYQGSQYASDYTWLEEDSQFYNNMGSTTAKTVTGLIEDQIEPERVKTMHFTNCQKPWKCSGFPYQKGKFCSEMHQLWWALRTEYEEKHELTHVAGCEANRPYAPLGIPAEGAVATSSNAALSHDQADEQVALVADKDSTTATATGREKVAVTITVLNEGKDSLLFLDGAAIMAHSIKRSNR